MILFNFHHPFFRHIWIRTRFSLPMKLERLTWNIPWCWLCIFWCSWLKLLPVRGWKGGRRSLRPLTIVMERPRWKVWRPGGAPLPLLREVSFSLWECLQSAVVAAGSARFQWEDCRYKLLGKLALSCGQRKVKEERAVWIFLPSKLHSLYRWDSSSSALKEDGPPAASWRRNVEALLEAWGEWEERRRNGGWDRDAVGKGRRDLTSGITLSIPDLLCELKLLCLF